MPHTAFDPALAEAQWSGMADDTRRMILGIFAEECDELCGKARAALADGDSGALARAAHTLRGAAANVGALHLAAASEALEAAATTGSTDILVELVERMTGAGEAVRAAIATGEPYLDRG